MKNIADHPSIQHAQDFAALCKPLEKLNITYFSHARVDAAGEISGANNHPAFLEHYIQNEYFNIDVHVSESDLIQNYFLADNLTFCGESRKLQQAEIDHGIKHVFTIIEENSQASNYYHFATNHSNSSINQVYLNNVDLLELFIAYFKEQVNASKKLQRAYDIKFLIDDNKHFLLATNDDEYHRGTARKEFLKSIQFNNRVEIANNEAFTLRELEVLFWLHYGKTSYDISRLLNLAEVTVNKHISRIKSKAQCFTQFQLGELFSSLFKGSEDILNSLVCK